MSQEIFDEEIMDIPSKKSGKAKVGLSFPKWTKFVLGVFVLVGAVWGVSVIFTRQTQGNAVNTAALRPSAPSEFEAVGTEVTEEYSRKVEDYAKAKAEEAAGSGRSYVAPVTPSGRPVLETNDKRIDAAPVPETPGNTAMASPPAREVRVMRQQTPRDDKLTAYLSQLHSQLQMVQKPSVSVLNNPAPLIIASSNGENGEIAVDTSIPPGVKSGDILYSINRVSLNSDAPGPAMVEVIDGPYAGGKAIGQFKRSNEHLTLEFTSLTLPDGTRYAIRGYAIDPRTDQTAVRSDVDNHTFERWFKYAAAKFLEGFGEAVASSGASSSYSIYGGGYSIPNYNVRDELWIAGGKVGQGAARIFERDFDKPPTVTLDSGTEIGILIVSVGKAEGDQSAGTVLQSRQQTARQRDSAPGSAQSGLNFNRM